jgi:DNA-binding NarL/FixJ family response regulator
MASSSRHAINVLLADPHRIVCEGVSALLAGHADIRVVGAVGNGREAVKEAERLGAHVLVMETALPGLGGIEAARALRSRKCAAGVIFLSSQLCGSVVQDAIDAGARGYLGKDIGAGELLQAIRAVAAGKRYFAKAIADKLLDGLGPDSGPRLLSAREREIVRLVADGKSNAEAAKLVNLSARTVETYRIRIMRKLGCDGMAALMKYAIREGLTTLY